MKATTNHTTDLDVNIKKKPTPQTPPRAEAWYVVMGGVLFLILTLVLVVILAWVHWGTGMVSRAIALPPAVRGRV